MTDSSDSSLPTTRPPRTPLEFRRLFKDHSHSELVDVLYAQTQAAIEAEAAAPDAGLREALDLIDALLSTGGPAPGTRTEAREFVQEHRAALAAHPAPAPATYTEVERLEPSTPPGLRGHRTAARLAAYPPSWSDTLRAAPAGPAVHMKQSGNGCVTCLRKWSQHTDAEKRMAYKVGSDDPE